MTEETPDFSETPEISVGQRLSEARELCGETQQDVALQLNLTMRYVKALETDDYKALPGPAYVKGYIRAYARHVKISGDELVMLYQQQTLNESPVKQLGTVNKIEPQVRLSDPMMRFSLILFILALLGASIWWWQTQSGGDAQTVSPATQSDAAPSSSLPDDPVGEGAVADSAGDGSTVDDSALTPVPGSETYSLQNDEADPGQTAEADSLAEPAAGDSQGITAARTDTDSAAIEGATANDTQQAVADPVDEAGGDESVAESEAPLVGEPQGNQAEQPGIEGSLSDAEIAALDQPAAQSSGVLELSFAGDCWVSIRDASEKLVFANTKRAGENLRIELDLPARLLVGRVSAVANARFNDAPLDLQAHAVKEVARMTLEPQDTGTDG